MGKIARFFRRAITVIAFCAVPVIALPQYSSSLLSNKSGSSVSKYDVVVWDTANSNAFKTTTTSRDIKVIGVVTATSIANNAAGMITQPGAIVKVRVTGTVTRGDYVVTSTTAGAGASGGTADISGAFGVALETGTSTNIYVYLFSPQLFSTTVGPDPLYANTIALKSGTTATLFNTATTVNAFGAATALNMGAATGLTTINNGLKVALSTGLALEVPGAGASGIQLYLGQTGVNPGGFKLWGSVAGRESNIYNDATYAFHVDTNSNGRAIAIDGLKLIINSPATAGYRVGIGTASPAVTLDVVGDIASSGDLAVNGGDLTSTASSFNLLATPTTITFGAAATTLNIGAATGTCTVANTTLAAKTITSSVRMYSSAKVTFTANDTTPTVAASNLFVVPGTWTAGNNVTALDDGVQGQVVYIEGGDTDCVFNDASTLVLSAAWTAAANASLTLIFDGSSWIELCRSAN